MRKAGMDLQDEHQFEGISGATITSRGVEHLMNFWLEEARFGKYLENFRAGTLSAGGNG